jgi:hypothetical protein
MLGLAGAATVAAGRAHTPKVSKNNAMSGGEEQFMVSVIDGENTGSEPEAQSFLRRDNKNVRRGVFGIASGAVASFHRPAYGSDATCIEIAHCLLARLRCHLTP